MNHDFLHLFQTLLDFHAEQERQGKEYPLPTTLQRSEILNIRALAARKGYSPGVVLHALVDLLTVKEGFGPDDLGEIFK